MRYVIAVPDGKFADWQARCVEHLTSAGARPIGVIATKSKPTYSFFWSLAIALSRPRALHQAAKVPDVPLLPSADAIGDDSIDFVLDFGDDAHRNSVARALIDKAKSSCWRFAFAPSPAGAPPGAGDLAAGREVTEAALVSCDASGVAHKVLMRGALFVERSSLWRQIDSLLYEVARWPAHACNRLRAGDGSSGSGDVVADADTLLQSRQTDGPQGLLGFIVRLVVSGAAAFWRRLFFSSSWNMGVAKAPIESFSKGGQLPAIVWYPKADVQRFAADPFGLIVDGKQVVLCESLFPGADGTIHSATFDGASWSKDLEPSLELPFHLSYPYLIRRDGEIYCVPEASGSGEIAMYRAVRFPDRWEKQMTLLPGIGGVDASIVQFDGVWWMFAGDIADGPDHKLSVWHSEDLFGPWHAHAGNPVKIDIRSARGAGTPFVVDGTLYRPSQDCSQTYGGRVIVNRIRKLTHTEFVEEPASIVNPKPDGPYRFGLHTLSRFGEYTLVDCKQRFVSVSWFVRMLKRPLRALRK